MGKSNMREILFKGKQLKNIIETSNRTGSNKGTWHYGNYVRKIGNGIIKDKHFICNLSTGECIECDEKTICQYTELKDIRKTKIFDGDIVEGCSWDWGYKKGKAIVKIANGGIEPFSIKGWECTENNDKVKVVGNIHDIIGAKK